MLDIKELRKKPHLSVSAINTYLECSLKYRFSRIDYLPRECVSDNLIFGSVIHSVLADYNQERMIGGTVMLNDLLNAFAVDWENAAKDNPNVDYSKGKDYPTLLMEGKKLLEVFYNKQLDCNEKSTILSIEEPFQFYVPDVSVPMIGVMDVVEECDDKTILITEYKTASKSYSINAVAKLFQLSVYHIAARKNGFADRNIELRVDTLIKTKVPKFESLYTTRNELDCKRTTKLIQEVWKGIRSGVFVPNDSSWQCARCEYANACREWTNEEEVAYAA